MGILGPLGILIPVAGGDVNRLAALRPSGAVGADNTGDLVVALIEGPFGALGGGKAASCLGGMRALIAFTI